MRHPAILALAVLLSAARLAAAQECITCWTNDCRTLEGIVKPCHPPKKAAPKPPEVELRQKVARAVLRNMNQVRFCYERALMRDPNLRGTIVMDFSVKADGTTEAVKATRDTMNAPDVQACLVGAVKRWRLLDKVANPPLHVTYPFTFTPT